MAVQSLCVLPVGGHDYSFWRTAVVGKVKETVPWPFPIDISAVVVLATKHQRAATSAHDIPGEEIMPATSIYVLRICGRGAGQETSSSLFGR